MADANKLREALSALANLGVSFGDVTKALKELKDKGVIKSSGRGKAPSDDPTRLAIKGALTSINIDGATLINTVVREAKDSVSYMVTLSPEWKVNFVKTVKRPAKPKKSKTEAPTEFAEPTVV